MPIGLLIGWLIGQLYIGTAILITNQGHRRGMSETSILVRQSFRVIGMIFVYTALPALIGTLIELYVR